MENDTKKQHFIPKFYLKNFSDKKNFLEILDIKNNRLCKPKNYSGVGYGHYFYALKTGVPDEISQFIEKWLQKYEDIISRTLPVIIDKIISNKQITDDDKYILSSLMCMLWLRTPSMRDQLNKTNRDILKKITKHFSSNDKKQLNPNLLNNNFNNAQHLQFMTKTFGFGSSGFINMFFSQHWTIYISKGEKKFITTDNPVVEWWLPPQTFYGASFLERNKYFSLTPEIFIELKFPFNLPANITGRKIKRKTVFKDRDDIIYLFNILLASHSHRFAYAKDKNILERLVRGRNNPGKLEQQYYNKYEKPWDEHYFRH